MEGMVKGVALHKNEFEDSLWYELDQQKINLVAVHLPQEPQRIYIAAFAKDASLDDTPLVEHEISSDEARLRYEFFSQLHNAGWLQKSA